jgi:hypothetical protein
MRSTKIILSRKGEVSRFKEKEDMLQTTLFDRQQTDVFFFRKNRVFVDKKSYVIKGLTLDLLTAKNS